MHDNNLWLEFNSFNCQVFDLAPKSVDLTAAWHHPVSRGLGLADDCDGAGDRRPSKACTPLRTHNIGGVPRTREHAFADRPRDRYRPHLDAGQRNNPRPAVPPFYGLCGSLISFSNCSRSSGGTWFVLSCSWARTVFLRCLGAF